MATKTRTRKTRSRSSSAGEGVIKSAITAAEELGAAAVSLKHSWDHIQNARSRGRRATSTVKRAAKTVSTTVTRAAHKVMPSSRSHRRTSRNRK